MKRLLVVISSAVLLLAVAACSSGGVSTWCKIGPQPYYTFAKQADYGITNNGSSSVTISSYGIEIFRGSNQDFSMSDSDAGDDVTIAPGQTYVQSGQNGWTESGGLDSGDNRCDIVINGS